MKIFKILIIIVALIAVGYSCSYAIDITSWEDLAKIGNDGEYPLNGSYTLTANLSSSTPGYDTYAGPSANSGQGWVPIASGTVFSGTIDGNYHTISDLYISRSAANQALIYKTDYAGSYPSISNLGLVNVDITNTNFSLGYTSTLIGWAESTTIQNVFVTGTLEATGGGAGIGGMVAVNYYSTVIENSYTAVDITGNGNNTRVGGIAGYSYQYAPEITDTYAIGEINSVSTAYVGGFVGYNSGTVFSEDGWYDRPGDVPTQAIDGSPYDVEYSNANDPPDVNNKLAWIVGLDTLGLSYFPSDIDLLVALSDGESVTIDGTQWFYYSGTPPGGPYDPGYAFSDGGQDYIQLATSYGTTGGSGPSAVPEPATVISFILGGAGLAVKRFFMKK